MITRRGLLKLFGAAFTAMVATAAYPFTEVMATPHLRRYTFRPTRWTDGLKLRVCVLADFHACEPWMDLARMESICVTANELKPDIFLLLGDYAAVASADWAKVLTCLSAPLGVHAILGNHDYWEDLKFQADPTADNIATTALRNVGIATYINEAVRLEKDGHPFWLAGLGDQMALRPGKRFNRRFMQGIDDLDTTMALITDEAPAILMAHEPDIFPKVGNRISLTLSGHTHGGQINLFGWHPVAASRGSRRYPGGHFREENGDLIVSRGLGCTFLPIRVGVQPEILLLELG
ncbi:metallophosphoesterase [Rhizobium sp. RAF56]|uniref:metallophosphoesterase n=1 Tax=Rhizobium sp. RAF56 TaxID=3233062 RepID=UPI003F949061